nr:MAG TPA: hypothetical protein [Bacteriophage sp.]
MLEHKLLFYCMRKIEDFPIKQKAYNRYCL